MPVVIAVKIPVAPTVPTVVVLAPSAIPFPIAFKETVALVTRPHPASLRIRRTCPVPVVPPVTPSVGIPIAIYPKKARTGAVRANAYHARRRRRSDANPD
jgi:hypothetical protein